MTDETKSVPHWGQVSDGGLFIIRGARPAFDHMVALEQVFPTALVHLPGMYTPFFPKSTPAAFAEAFDRLLGNHKNITVMGVSIGGVVAMAMRHPGIRHLILIDTPLQTAPLWPLHGRFRRDAGSNPAAQQWFADLFGLLPDRVVNRDYRGLLEHLRVPTTLLMGDIPLEPERPLKTLPGLIAAEDRALYEAHPLVEVIHARTGHNVPGEAFNLFMDTVRKVLRGTRPLP